jgi:hypothetical protein
MPTIPISSSKHWKQPEPYQRTDKDRSFYARTIYAITPLVEMRIGTLVYPVVVELTCGHKVEHHVHAKDPQMHLGCKLFCPFCFEAPQKRGD